MLKKNNKIYPKKSKQSNTKILKKRYSLKTNFITYLFCIIFTTNKKLTTLKTRSPKRDIFSSKFFFLETKEPFAPRRIRFKSNADWGRFVWLQLKKKLKNVLPYRYAVLGKMKIRAWFIGTRIKVKGVVLFWKQKFLKFYISIQVSLQVANNWLLTTTVACSKSLRAKWTWWFATKRVYIDFIFFYIKKRFEDICKDIIKLFWN